MGLIFAPLRLCAFALNVLVEDMISRNRSDQLAVTSREAQIQRLKALCNCKTFRIAPLLHHETCPYRTASNPPPGVPDPPGGAPAP